MDCQTHVWSGPMGELLTSADHNCVWQPMPYRKSSVSHDSDALMKQFGLVFNNGLRREVVVSLHEKDNTFMKFVIKYQQDFIHKCVQIFYWYTSFVCSQDALHVSCTHRLHMHGNTLTLLYIPRTIQDFHAHLYVPCAIQDFHASLVLPKGRIDYIRPLGHIGFSCIYTSLRPYRIYMHLYVPWAV